MITYSASSSRMRFPSVMSLRNTRWNPPIFESADPSGCRDFVRTANANIRVAVLLLQDQQPGQNGVAGQSAAWEVIRAPRATHPSVQNPYP